ncbi:CU044_5270 family protein [Streptomyces sp. NPDC093228]|uniref:CU044_5270 family protein n=1 Tax=unclassified Streptomyces TaxID=2593676 RepID=UPI000740D04B|nr:MULTISPECIES: CU044_5270 family protein [unclassified Streptomyces]KUJ38091.1 hypothetical protein ADL25_25580 [Streptomyces sp. NRRL F-5122]MDX3265098.1 CU044_5270 family protein [Streptomyces sp. MI02-2A]REE62605.1 hypothetical protein BX257_5231 [Streptomyces sp. 3212.3]
MNQLPERDLPPGRHHLLKEHLMTEIRRETGTPARVRTTWLRPALAAAAVATAAAVTLVVLPASSGGGASGRQTDEAATALLENIALAAEHAGVPSGIRDDQFVYIKSRDAYATPRAGGPAELGPVHDREIWLSVDGRHRGLLEEDRPGNEHVTLEPTSPGSRRAADYRALSKLPTDPDEMRDWLYEISAGEVDTERPDKDYAAFVLLGDLIRESLMPPKVSAALYRAAAGIPGVTLVRHVEDSTGREGVAVTRGSGDGSDQLIFDPKTYAFLGERQLDAKGQVTGVSAVLERTVVDKAGERP